ncbi:hypothetical protein VCUG_02435 [Vavraia culicis subsp. floridensis]|uniref:Uncharacterized protein n=1 Tax=Vavraia culicis (isolate floridensis) TaxID=948595 RepID=L2GRZ2_VAVCU|nr:uncharacterized protein VCUG_02435 [Vavraia culicis subsp. floridensis]ELA46073.1 hypothetical protein VCUG_02435 [Vavraia culicis subsp. floridensis]
MPSAWYLTSFISIPLLLSIPLTHPLFHLTRPISLPSLLIPSIPPQNIPSHGAKIAKAMTQCTFLFNRNSAEQLIIHSIYLITHSIYLIIHSIYLIIHSIYLITHICKNTYISMPQHFHAFIRFYAVLRTYSTKLIVLHTKGAQQVKVA